MTIQELADRSEVTTRTIRYYVEQGLLPPPERGRPAEYTEEHVARLALIKRLKEQYLPLEEIRDTLQRLSITNVEALVADYSPQQVQTQKLDSAADYISSVLTRGAVREQMKQRSSPITMTDQRPLTAELAPSPMIPPEAVPSDRALQEQPMRQVEPAPPAAHATPPPTTAAVPMSPVAPVATPAQGSSLASRLWSSVVGRRSTDHEAANAKEGGAYIESPTYWRRVQLGEGIELNYVASGDARFNDMVMRLIESARRALDEGPGNGE